MLLCILLIPYAESLAPPNSSCAVQIYMLDFYGLSRAIPIANHDKKKQLSPNQPSWEFSHGFFWHMQQIFQPPIFFSTLNFFWPSFKKPLYNLQPRFFLSSFLFTSLNLFSLELLENLYPLLLYYKYGQSIHHLHYMLIFFALS